jgi:hypothetical protein
VHKYVPIEGVFSLCTHSCLVLLPYHQNKATGTLSAPKKWRCFGAHLYLSSASKRQLIQGRLCSRCLVCGRHRADRSLVCQRICWLRCMGARSARRPLVLCARSALFDSSCAQHFYNALHSSGTLCQHCTATASYCSATGGADRQHVAFTGKVLCCFLLNGHQVHAAKVLSLRIECAGGGINAHMAVSKHNSAVCMQLCQSQCAQTRCVHVYCHGDRFDLACLHMFASCVPAYGCQAGLVYAKLLNLARVCTCRRGTCCATH